MCHVALCCHGAMQSGMQVAIRNICGAHQQLDSETATAYFWHKPLALLGDSAAWHMAYYRKLNPGQLAVAASHMYDSSFFRPRNCIISVVCDL